MKVLKYPIIPIALFLSLGIFADYYLKPAGTILIVLGCLASFCFAAAFIQAQRSLFNNPIFLISTLLISFTTGMVCHWLHFSVNNARHYSHLLDSDDENILIKGVISERLKPTDFYEKYYFKVRAVNNKDATGKILLSVPIDSLRTKLQGGQVIVIADTPQPILKPLNPYQFDYAVYLQKQNIFHQLRLKDNFLITGIEKNFDYYIDSLRTTLMSSFDIHEYKPAVRDIINALLFGQRQDIDKNTSQNYTDAGVVHILAISGLHFATLFYILTLLLKPLSRFNHHGRLIQLILILGTLWTFAFITGLSASVVRSVVMFSFICTGQYFNRNTSIYNSIAVSMLVLLLANPNFLFDVGFQLSYAAVLAIVCLQPLYSRIRKSKYKLLNYINDTIIISLVAQLGVFPLSLYYFNQFPLLFLVANIIVIPLSTAILLLGIAVLILNFIFPALAIIIGKVLAWLIILMNGFIEWIASFDAFVLKNIPFTLLLNISAYIIIILFMRWLYKKTYVRTAALLASVIVFQLLYTLTVWKANSVNELIVFNERKATTIAVKDKQHVQVYSTDSLANEKNAIASYKKENFSKSISLSPIKNIMWFNDYRVMVIDSFAIYPANANPEVVLLTQSPKINLERMLSELKPKQVIADGTNFRKSINRWRNTCTKAKIPFHASTTDGFYRLTEQ